MRGKTPAFRFGLSTFVSKHGSGTHRPSPPPPPPAPLAIGPFCPSASRFLFFFPLPAFSSPSLSHHMLQLGTQQDPTIGMYVWVYVCMYISI